LQLNVHEQLNHKFDGDFFGQPPGRFAGAIIAPRHIFLNSPQPGRQFNLGWMRAEVGSHRKLKNLSRRSFPQAIISRRWIGMPFHKGCSGVLTNGGNKTHSYF
jgi:hypothetical protein